MRLRLPALAAGLLMVSAAAAGDKPNTGFVNKTFKNPDGSESPYVLFVPHSYDGSKPVPVILFLHGAGETKSGKKKDGTPVKEGKMPVEVGLGPHIKGQREKSFPALVIIPRAEGFGWQAEGPNGRRALAILDEVMKEYKTDPDRVYLTGLSMGGYGTWSLAAAHPDRWAAIVPICGGGDPKAAEKIKHIPCWVWHGDRDGAVKVDLSRQMVEALKKAGGEPRYTELEWIGHNSWDAAYASDDLYAWLFRQRKK
jgi:predicted peptidase